MGKRERILFIVIIFLLIFQSCKDNPEETNAVAANDEDLVENVGTHEDSDDYSFDESQAVTISLQDNASTTSGSGVTISNNKVTITNAGSYNISGSLSNGQLIVNTEDNSTVKLQFNGIDIKNSTTSPVYIVNAKKTVIKLADNTSNYITDGTSYSFSDGTDEPNAALFSKTDFTIYGNGSLNVDGNYNDAIAGKDGLIMAGGNITITSADDGIRGRDYLVIGGGSLHITASGDGLKADNSEDAGKGYISFNGGNCTIVSGGDGLDAAKDAIINNGTLNITAGGGSSKSASSTVSKKGIVSSVSTTINNGTINISSADDALHSNNSLTINDGNLALSSGDDGIHSDATLTINNGTIIISKCYEGIESEAITINNGNITLTSGDDGINGAGGVDGSGNGQFASAGNYSLNINGGYIAVYATGDGLDVNGSITMTGGTVLVHGPTANDNGAIDYDSSFNITGGIIIAAGSSGMAQAPGSTSKQYSLLVTFSKSKSANSLFHIQKSDGTEVLTFAPVKTYQSIAVSMPELTKGSSYDIYVGGSSTGTLKDGLYTGGTYSGGTKSTTLTISSTTTKVNL
jgi:hypothetical protein